MHPVRLTARALIFSVLCAAISPAQTSRGTVTGVVSDATRAAVPSATVEIINKETNVSRKTSTNAEGVYRFDAVDLGTYDITVSHTGFKTYTSRSVPVSAAQVVGVNAQLEIGENLSVIEVAANAVPLQTE